MYEASDSEDLDLAPLPVASSTPPTFEAKETVRLFIPKVPPLPLGGTALVPVSARAPETWRQHQREVEHALEEHLADQLEELVRWRVAGNMVCGLLLCGRSAVSYIIVGPMLCA